jgi:hypothetical protein
LGVHDVHIVKGEIAEMLLQLRVGLPDRPGSLGQVARTLGVAGADIVQVVVLERVGGRAVDDFTVIWPTSTPLDRMLSGLRAISGVLVDGVWRCTELPDPGGRDAALLGQVAANPEYGLATLVDGVPGMFGADWAVAAAVDPQWAAGPVSSGLLVVHASWGAPAVPGIPEIAPLRPRAMTGVDRTHLAVAPFQRAGLVLVAARGGAVTGDPVAEGSMLFAPQFHRSEVERLAQLVGATAAVLGDQLDGLVPSARGARGNAGCGEWAGGLVPPAHNLRELLGGGDDAMAVAGHR